MLDKINIDVRIKANTRAVAMLLGALENARTAIDLAGMQIEAFCGSLEAEAKKGCQHPEDKLENISGMGERPTYLCTACKEIVVPRDDEGEEREIGNGEDRS